MSLSLLTPSQMKTRINLRKKQRSHPAFGHHYVIGAPSPHRHKLSLKIHPDKLTSKPELQPAGVYFHTRLNNWADKMLEEWEAADPQDYDALERINKNYIDACMQACEKVKAEGFQAVEGIE